MATERNTQSKYALEFGKATMYVISDRGLHTEPCNYSKETDSKVFMDKAVFSGKKVKFSQSRSVDFNWKEISNTSKKDRKIKILNMNELAVDDKIKTLVRSRKTRYCTGATRQSEYPNRYTFICDNASKVNDTKQCVNHENSHATRLSTVCDEPVDDFEKSTSQGNPERETRMEAQKLKEEWYEKRRLPCSHYKDSDTSEQTFQTSKDQTNIVTLVKQNDSVNSSLFHCDSTIQDEKPERPGKCYLKRIFYPKGNPSYLKPSNLRCLPEISGKSENHLATNQERDLLSTSSYRETRGEKKSSKLGSNRLLLPLNINVLKNSEKQKHHLKSIVKLPTVVDNNTGQVHLSLEAIAFEQSDYNKWSRRQKRIEPENSKISNFAFPVIAKNSR